MASKKTQNAALSDKEILSSQNTISQANSCKNSCQLRTEININRGHRPQSLSNTWLQTNMPRCKLKTRNFTKNWANLWRKTYFLSTPCREDSFDLIPTITRIKSCRLRQYKLGTKWVHIHKSLLALQHQVVRLKSSLRMGQSQANLCAAYQASRSADQAPIGWRQPSRPAELGQW